jgi:hypothetical protein
MSPTEMSGLAYATTPVPPTDALVTTVYTIKPTEVNTASPQLQMTASLKGNEPLPRQPHINVLSDRVRSINAGLTYMPSSLFNCLKSW